MVTILLAMIAAALVWIALTKARESGRREATAVVPGRQPAAPRVISLPRSGSTDVADFETVEREMSIAENLMTKGQAAFNRSDLNEAIEGFVGATNASWRAVRHLMLEWHSAWASPLGDPDMMRSVVTATLEELVDKNGAQSAPLAALLLNTHQAYAMCAMLSKRAPLELAIPSLADLKALVDAERAFRTGTPAIVHHRAAMDAAFEDLGSAWERYVRVQDSITRIADLIEPLADLVQVARATFITTRVALPILLWP